MAKKRIYGLIHNGNEYQYQDWEACDKKIKELPGAKKHKGFSSKRLMLEWFEENKSKKPIPQKMGIPLKNKINVNQEISQTFDELANLHKPNNLSDEDWHCRKKLCYQKLASCFREL